ncbi:hypothetical protein SKAU_G00361820 [Synaphobranchus kaupii]|uniref:CW-type domain-containing protein n=1 Tax=Synaphobranchus kaupii TaxID=118154 RepID=A0A9Q1EIC2_SYNKA|nr:hypothetical protein SKAU_G00361820 [Synaphobranchus kaupii]
MCVAPLFVTVPIIALSLDNAYDPDVNANQIWIDWTKIKDFDCLTFTDNGAGMDFQKMHKMLSFGFSDKQGIGGHAAVGLYGNGFKSGSMYLGKDAIVFSKQADGMVVGLLSQTYLVSTKAQYVVVPIISFRKEKENNTTSEHRNSLKAILEHSLFETEEELLHELEVISTKGGPSGTRIIIWNLRRTSNGQTEFDFNADSEDIQIPDDDSTNEQQSPIHRQRSVPEYLYSLRAYCSILYLKPWMQILIGGKKVKTQLVAKSLGHTVKDKYTPRFLKEHVNITFGYRTKSKGEYGIMMYHNNRLIRPYVRLGCQLKANAKGVGVVGIIECDFLKPTHNKQEFDDSEEYRKIKHNLGMKLEEYWDEIRNKRMADPGKTKPIDDTEDANPDQNWVQCNTCLKWRKLADGVVPEILPDLWFCHMNDDSEFRSCRVEEEPQDSYAEQPYEKKYKQEKKKQKQQKKEPQAQNSEDSEPTPNTSATSLKHSGTQQRIGDTQTNLSNSSSPLSCSGDDHSADSLLATSTTEAASPYSRMKRKLFTRENEEVKRAKMNDQQNSTSEAVASVASADLCLPLLPVTVTLEQNSMQDELTSK